jgi:MFS family permease
MLKRQLSLLSPSLRWFLLAMILANIGGEMAYGLLPVYLRELGATVAQVGLVFSVMSLILLVLQLFGGLLSDALGRLRTIALGSVAAATGYLLLPLSPSWRWVMLALGLETLSGALVGPSFAPFIAEQSSEENRGRVFGLAYGVFMVVSVIGPALGGSLAGHLGFRAMLLVAFVLYACAAGLRVWMARCGRFAGTRSAQRPTLQTLQEQVRQMARLWAAGGLLPWIGLTLALRDSALQLCGQMQPLYLAQVAGLSLAQIGWLGSAAGTAKMGATYLAGGFADRRGERLAITGGLLLEATGLLIFVLARSLWAFAAAMAVVAAGGGVLMTAYSSLLSRAVPEKSRGLASATLQTTSGFLQLPAPWMGGQVWERLSPRAPFAISAATILMRALPARFKLKRVGGREE